MILDTPLGHLTLAFDADAALTRIAFVDEPAPDARVPAPVPEARAAKTVAALRAYFDGDLAALDGLPVAPRGTPFQLDVWRALRRVPPGTTTSYGAIARELGTSPRAVGAANGANPIALVVPCHRVFGKGGALTGYAYGLPRKRWLLAHEHALGALPLVS